MKKFFPLLLLVAGISLAASNVTNQKVVPQAPVSVACDVNGNVAYTPSAEVVRYDVWNTSTANDVCVAFCGSSLANCAPNRASIATCSFVLGPYSGSGTPDVWTVSATLDADTDKGIANFECDAAGASTLVVTEWHRIR